MKTREITQEEKRHADVSDQEVDTYQLIRLDNRDYIQINDVRLTHGKQRIMVIDVTDEKDDILVNHYGMAYVAMGEGRYVLVLTTCSYAKTHWTQYIPADIFIKVEPLRGSEKRDAESDWLESQFDN